VCVASRQKEKATTTGHACLCTRSNLNREQDHSRLGHRRLIYESSGQHKQRKATNVTLLGSFVLFVFMVMSVRPGHLKKRIRAASDVYSISFNWASWILKECIEVQERKGKLLSWVHVLHKTWKKEVYRRRRATTAKKCTKMRDARIKLLFCQSKPINFLPSSLLKLPNLSNVKDGKQANKIPLSPKKYCYSLLKGMWVDCLCHRSPVEIQIYITN